MAKRAPAKNMSLDKLARMVQRGFAEGATKVELRATNERVDRLSEDVKILRADMEAGFHDMKNFRAEVRIGFQNVTETLMHLTDQVRTMMSYGPQIRDLAVRMERVERKLRLRR